MSFRPNRKILLAVSAAVLCSSAFIQSVQANGESERPIKPREVGSPRFPAADPFQIGPALFRAKTKIIPLSKIVDGQQVKIRDLKLVCPPPGNEVTRRLTYTVRAPINSWLCDEFCSKPALNGTFIATFVVDRREHLEPKRGCFTGTWIIKNSLGATTATGTMHGTVRAGTHDILTDVDPQDCEQCGERFHFEGCMEGTAKASRDNRIGQPPCKGRLCATFQGIGLDPDRPTPGVTPFIENPGFVMRIEGAIFEPCPPIVFNPTNQQTPGLPLPEPTHAE